MRQVFGATLATASGVTNAQCGMCSDLLGRTWHRTKCLQLPKAVINFPKKLGA
jgi:hypothetical protein